MNIARAALEAYAARELPDHIEVVSFGDTAETFAPEAFAALRAVLDIHRPSVLRAGVMPDEFGADRCAFCHQSEPVRRFRGDINGRWMDAHEHADPNPFCDTCDDGSGEFSEPWPCPTVRAIIDALGAE